MMQNNYTSKGKHLTETERLLIERWHSKENSVTEKLLIVLVKRLKRFTTRYNEEQFNLSIRQSIQQKLHKRTTRP